MEGQMVDGWEGCSENWWMDKECGTDEQIENG